MSNPCASYIDSQNCVVTPACPANSGTPAHIEQVDARGWGTGANSILVRDGDLYARFDMPIGVVGVYIGLRAAVRYHQHLPIYITHGFYFERDNGDMVRVVESGVQVMAPVVHRATDVFEIRRIAGVVTYWINGDLTYESSVRSSGLVLVNACLYASNDDAPSGSTSGGLSSLFNPELQGQLASDGTPLTVRTNPANDGWHDWFWTVTIPAGARSYMDVALTDNTAGDFAALGGMLVVGPLPASDAMNNPQATDQNPPFTAHVGSLSAATYYVMLRCPASVTGLTLAATVSVLPPPVQGGATLLLPDDNADLGVDYTYVPTQPNDSKRFFFYIDADQPRITVDVTDTAGGNGGEWWGGGGVVVVVDPDGLEVDGSEYDDGEHYTYIFDGTFAEGTYNCRIETGGDPMTDTVGVLIQEGSG